MNCLSTLTALAVISGFGIVLQADEQQLKTIDELLAAKVTVDFGQQSFESAVAETEKQFMETHKLSFPLRITIVGQDLKFEGITRNQLIRRFSQREKSLADVLTALVIRASPVTVTLPSDPNLMLVWVTAPDEKSILITTRKAAKAKSYKLPKVFESR